MLFGLVAGDNDTVTDSIDLVEVAPMQLGRPASVPLLAQEGQEQE
jgi:hypothetical protein